MPLRRRKPETDPSPEQDFLAECADLGTDRLTAYTLYESYYDGDQSTKLTKRTKKFLEQHASQVTFCENFVEVVVDALAERLTVTGFGTFAGKGEDGKEQPNEELHDYIQGLWEANLMDAEQDVIHTVTLVKGDAALIADYDEEKGARLTYNDPGRLAFHYSNDRPDELEYVVKCWGTSTKGIQNPEGKAILRMNLYYPDRIEKFFKLSSGKEGDWAQWNEEGETWPVWWTDTREEGGAPLGIPVFHFRYKSLGRCYGRSRAKSAIPFQDELNKQIIDLMMLVDQYGMPDRYFFGVDPTTVNLEKSYGGYVASSTPAADVTVGEFPPAAVTGPIQAIESILSRLARRSRVPMHLLTGGNMPSGESIKASESGLVMVAKSAQTNFGNVWEEAMRMLVRLEQTFGTEAPAADLSEVTIRCEWDDPQTRNELEEAQTALVYDELGVSNDTNLTRLGFDPSEEKAKKEEEAAVSLKRQEQFFNKGDTTTEPPPPGQIPGEPDQPAAA